MIKREDFGKPFALHASREIDGDVLFDRLPKLAPELFPDDDDAPSLPWRRLAEITSAAIAVATITDVLHIEGWQEDAISTALERAGLDPETQLRFTFGPVVYLLRDVRSLPKPVPCRGWQGFWTLTADVAARVKEQL